MAQTGSPTIGCPSCGTPNPTGFRFCGGCGASLERTCPSCSATVPAGFRFCGNCGAEAAEAAGVDAAIDEERKVVTVVFADLEASTELATRLDPEDLREGYKPYFEAMAEEILRHGGTVEKFIGDAVVGVFGAPVTHGDDPVRAVRAALAMQGRLPDLNDRLAGTAGGRLALRVGVQTGEVLAGRVTEQEGGVTGETTSIAARLQTVAPTGGVVVGERTFRDTARAFEFDPLGAFELKGVPGPVGAWHALRERPSAHALAGPFVGRHDETELLSLLLRRCTRDGRPYVATVVGPAGIGKSRLTEEFADAAARGQIVGAEGCSVVRGRCLPYGEGLRLWPLADIVKTDLGVLDSDPPDAIVQKAHLRIGGSSPNEMSDADITTLLSSLGIAVDGAPLAGADRDTAERLIAGAWARYFTRLASERPLVVVVEDIHWADDALLEYLSTRMVAPTLFLCLARPELFERHPAWGSGHANFATIELAPLSRSEERTLVEGSFDADVAEDVVHAIVERAGGNPFFAGELTRMLVEHGAVAEDGGRWTIVGELPAQLPDTVQGAVAARIDRLPPGAKRAIQDASVVGRTFWLDALEALGSPDAAGSVDTLIGRGLVLGHPTSAIAGSRELLFQHVLIRDVAYAGITRARRTQAHGDVLDWIEDVTRGRDEEFAELVAHHAILAGDAERTVRSAMLAGHRHRRVYAAEEAIEWYERALLGMQELPDATPLVAAEIAIGRGEAFEQLDRFDEAEGEYGRALEIARSTGRAWLEAQTYAALARVLWRQDRSAEADAILPRALDAAGEAGAPDVEARLLSTAGEMASHRGDWSAGVGHLRRALAVAEAANDLEAEAYARHGLAEAHLFLGPLEEAYGHARRAVDLWSRLGQRPLLHPTQRVLGHASLLLGRPAEAEEALDQALEGNRELGQRREEPRTLATSMLVQLARGDLGSALHGADEALALARAVGGRRAELMSLVSRMLLLVELADPSAVERDLAVASAVAPATGDGSFDPVLVSLRGLLQRSSGRRDDAIAAFTDARRRAGDVLLHRLQVGRIEISAWELASDADGLLDSGRWLLGSAEGTSPPYEAFARTAIARAHHLLGDPGAARDTARIAIGDAEGAGDLPATWRAYGTAAIASEALGDAGEATTLRRRGSEVVRAMLASIDDRGLRRTFAGRADVATLVDAEER